MTHNKKALAMAVATSILLWGCGQPQQAEPKAAAPAAKQEAAKPLSKADVKLAPVQELVKGNGAEPATLDPAKTEGTVESNIQRDLYEGLVTTGPNGEIRPAVAESWETKDNKVHILCAGTSSDAVTASEIALLTALFPPPSAVTITPLTFGYTSFTTIGSPSVITAFLSSLSSFSLDETFVS